MPQAFDEELEDLVSQLEREPDVVGQHARNMAGRRRVFIKRIRYYAYFRVVNDGQRVQVLAFWHTSRGREPNL